MKIKYKFVLAIIVLAFLTPQYHLEAAPKDKNNKKQKQQKQKKPKVKKQKQPKKVKTTRGKKSKNSNQAASPRPTPTATASKALNERKAAQMLRTALQLISQKQGQRGLKVLQQIPVTYPDTLIRYEAHNEMGKYYFEKGEYETALKQFTFASKSEVGDIRAEALYQTGICYYNMNATSKAFTAYRKLINEFPWSIYANEAYYYIGLCHFRLKRWVKAIEAFEKVGTSIPTTEEKEVLTEAGQRVYVKLRDMDLIVLDENSPMPQIRIESELGDSEVVDIYQYGRDKADFMGSIMSKPGKVVKGDKTLQCVGTSSLKVVYLDKNTKQEDDVKKSYSFKMVSTATVGFMDGAYKEYIKAVFIDKPFFVKLKDVDADTTDGKDKIKVKMTVTYIKKKEFDESKDGIDLSDGEDEVVERGTFDVELVETDVHSGLFQTFQTLKSEEGEALWALKGDSITIEHMDVVNIEDNVERKVTFTAKVLRGGALQDIKIQNRTVSDLDIKAKKQLIESKILLKLANIFKEVGLADKAKLKADAGLKKVDTVLGIAMKNNLERKIIEDAFNVKWGLYLAQGNLESAMDVIDTLIKFYPDSVFVDKALMKIANVKIRMKLPEARKEALAIYTAILKLENSELKAEVTYRIGELKELEVIEKAKGTGTTGGGENMTEKQKNRLYYGQFARAMTTYKEVFEKYPDSDFAKLAISKVSNYYIAMEDYPRAIQLAEQVFQDYPDADFLDKVLMKWIIAAYSMRQLDVALEKCDQLISEFPNSAEIDKAIKYKQAMTEDE